MLKQRLDEALFRLGGWVPVPEVPESNSMNNKPLMRRAPTQKVERANTLSAAEAKRRDAELRKMRDPEQP